MTKSSRNPNRYKALIEKIFFDRYYESATELLFERVDFETTATELGLSLPKNLGDIVYSFRYRKGIPQSIINTQPDDMEWIIEGIGSARYAFRLVKVNRIIPNKTLLEIKIPDATPEIISHYSLSDEQALLAKVRYNCLIDIFLGLTSYSLQNHLRTTVVGVGQIEIDEIYVGIDKRGCQYILPVQAKGGDDQLSVVQTKQDILCCAEKFPQLICRAISTQFVTDNLIALFELTIDDNQVRIIDEKHYLLVPANNISSSDLVNYQRMI